MAANVEPSLDLADDSSGDFVMPTKRREPRKTMPSASDGEKGSNRDGELDSGGLKLNSSFSLNKVHSVLSSFVGQKKQLLESIGFGGLLSIHRQPKISRRLAFWLLRNMDNSSSSIVVRDGVKIPLKDADVNLVLGLPHNRGSTEGRRTSVCRAADIVKSLLGLGKHGEIRMDYIEHLLVKEYCGKMSIKEKLALKVAIVLFVDAYFFAPKCSPARVNYALLPYLVDPDAIQTVNWSAYVLKVVKEASIKVKHALSSGKKSVSLDCCLLFLEIYYLDNLETGLKGGDYIPLPRVSDFPYGKIKQIISEDTEYSKDGRSITFGKLKVKNTDHLVYGTNACYKEEEHQPDVMQKFREFTEQLEEYRKAYVDQIESLFINLEFSVSAYVSTVCESQKITGKGSYELTVPCAEGTSHVNQNSPEFSSGTMQSPSPTITQKFEAMDLCSPEVNVTNPVDGSTSPVIRSYGVYSAGPAFDLSAVRVSGDQCAFPDGSSIIRLSPNAMSGNGEQPGDQCIEKLKVKEYPDSPFLLMLEDQGIPKIAILSLQQELDNMSEDDLERYWFVHKTPTTISLIGRRIREEFTSVAEFTVAVVDAISRLFIHLDDIMYDGQNVKRWRHFLPASWSEVILHRIEFCWTEETANMFRGPNITYNVEECRMICAPVLVEASWSCYIWDFQDKVVTVIDPKRMVHDKDYVKFKHHLVVQKLNRGLQSCMGSSAEIEWSTNYLTVQGANCESWLSGLYSMFYSRVFDGRCLTQLIPRDVIAYARCRLLYQLLSMVGNDGQLPSYLSG